jgi:hypothetical protein
MDQAENPTGLAADVGVAADSDERREMPRCAVDAPVTLVVLSHGTMMVGRLTEISLSGCRLLLPKTLSHSASAAIECTFKIRGVGFRLGGIVEWAENNLAEVRFNAMSSRSRDDLMEVLCEVELENNAKLLASANSAVETPTADSPAIEIILAEVAARNFANSRPNGGAWNPFAGMAIGGTERKAPDLRPVAAAQSSSGPAAPAPIRSTTPFFPPAPAAAPAPARQRPLAPIKPATQPPKGRDRRAAHRCGVDTSAIIDLVKVGSKLNGHILDLSVGGCRIKTAERFPVGIYTRIETEFQLHGLPFRLGGVIQAIYDRNTVGIRFLDMSQRKKDQVAELVAEMEESASGQ